MAVEIIGHRGYSARAPENTVAAVRLAMACGASAVEWDMHISASGTPHAFHDDTVDRTTSGTGRFASLTDEEVEQLDAGSWFDPAFAGEPVPTLRTVLKSLDSPIRRIYPELKAYRSLSDVDRILDEVQESGWLSRTVFISMKWEALERIRSRSDTAVVGFIAETPERLPEAIDRAIGDERAWVDPDVRIALAHPREIERAHDGSVQLACWTVNDVETARRAVDIGIERLTTNQVELLLAWSRTASPKGAAVP